MKIAFILGHELPFPPKKGGGVNSLLDGLTQAMVKQGDEVTAYSPSVPGRPDFEILNGVRHIRVLGSDRNKSNLLNFAEGVPYALRVKKKLEEFDVLSCHLLQGFLFSNTRKAKIVTHTIHRDPKKFLYLFSGMDRIYSGTDTVTEDARNLVPSISGKFKTIYNCVNFDQYPEAVARKRDGSVRFLFVGRFSKDKGMETLIPAFCNAAFINKELHLRTIGPMTKEGGGDEDLVKELRGFVLEKGLEDRIKFDNPIYDKEELDLQTRQADVVVLPSIGGETLNMSILECSRLGKAFLISDLSANSPLIINGETGLFARVGDIEDWTNKILELSKDLDKIESFGKNSYSYGKSEFSCERIAKSYSQDFLKLIEGKRNV